MFVRDVLKVKGNAVYSVQPNQTVYEAIAKMDKLDIGALLVMEGENLKGVLSERDYRSKIILKGRSSKSTLVNEIMIDQVYCVGPTDSVQDCMSIMTEKKIRHLPVLQDEKVTGVVSIGDLVKSIISKQKVEIKNLRGYIQEGGTYPG